MAQSQNDSVTCRECGQRDDANYMEPTRRRMFESSLCFICLFWSDLLGVRDNPTTARIGGRHFTIGPEDGTPKGLRGFGGNPSIIRFADGRQVTTTNLWSQGQIPAHFRSRLPDNAQFVQRP